jgi:hypothetical protein
VELFHRLSRRTVYRRFFRAYDRLPESWYLRFTIEFERRPMENGMAVPGRPWSK